MKKMVSIGLSLFLFSVAYPQNLCIVGTVGSDSLVVLDYRTKEVVHSVANVKWAQDIRVSRDRRFGYVLLRGSKEQPENKIRILDLRTFAFNGDITLGEFQRPHWSLLNNDGQILWVAATPWNSIAEVDLLSRSVRRSWNTNQPGSYNFAVSTDGAKLYSANFDTTTVSIINRSEDRVKVLTVGGKPIGADASPDGKEIWISSLVTNTITIIDVASDSISLQFRLSGDGPVRLAFTPDGQYVLATLSNSEELHAYDAKTRALAWKVKLDGRFPKSFAISPDGRFAVVCFLGGNEVAVVDLVKRIVQHKIKVGRNPEGIAIIN